MVSVLTRARDAGQGLMRTRHLLTRTASSPRESADTRGLDSSRSSVPSGSQRGGWPGSRDPWQFCLFRHFAQGLRSRGLSARLCLRSPSSPPNCAMTTCMVFVTPGLGRGITCLVKGPSPSFLRRATWFPLSFPNVREAASQIEDLSPRLLLLVGLAINH